MVNPQRKIVILSLTGQGISRERCDSALPYQDSSSSFPETMAARGSASFFEQTIYINPYDRVVGHIPLIAGIGDHVEALARIAKWHLNIRRVP